MPRLGRRTRGWLIALILLTLVLAWYQGGEQAMRPIEQDIPVPAGAL